MTAPVDISPEAVERLIEDLCHADGRVAGARWLQQRMNVIRALRSALTASGERVAELEETLRVFSADYRLQTFEDRERFRASARSALAKGETK